MVYQMGLRVYGSWQLANDWRGGDHQPTDLHVTTKIAKGRTINDCGGGASGRDFPF